MKVPLYTIDHPYIKTHYPVVYNIFGGDTREDKDNSQPSDEGKPSTSTTGYNKYIEARKQLKRKLDLTT